MSENNGKKYLKEVVSKINKSAGNKLLDIRKLLVLTVKDVSLATGISRKTISSIEGGISSNSTTLGMLISFYGFNYSDFFNDISKLPPVEQIKRQMERYHKKIGSVDYQIIYKHPDLIDLIELRLIPAGLFNDWKTVTQVQDYCSEHFGYDYPSAIGTLNTAVSKGWLKQHPDRSPKAYKKG